MDNEKRVAGVAPGGFKDVYEVRILICCLLNGVSEPLSKEQIMFIFEENNLVNYFTFASAIAQLIQSQHVKLETIDGQDFYIIQEEGIKTAIVLRHAIPHSVRKKVVVFAEEMLSQIKRQRDNEVTIEPFRDGYIVKFCMHNNDFDLLDLKLYVPDKMQAKKVRSNFWKDPAYFYNKMINLLIDDK